jgi:hypothetical protein
MLFCSFRSWITLSFFSETFKKIHNCGKNLWRNGQYPRQLLTKYAQVEKK